MMRCAALLLLCGCHQMVPIQGVTPEPGRTISVDFKEPIEFQIVGARLQNLVRTQGTFMTNDGDSLIVQADYLWSSFGAKHPALNARLVIPRDNVAAIQEQRVSVWKSAVLAGAGVGAVALAIFSVDKLGGGGSGPGPGGPPRQ